MENYFIALFDIDWHGESHSRGDIVTAVPGEGPSSGAWASFEPLKGLFGQPKLTGVDDPDSGNLTFHYVIGKKGQEQTCFAVKCRVGLPQGYAEIEEACSAKDEPSPVRVIEKPLKLEYGAGLATTAGRSFVGFVSKSNVKKTPVREVSLFDDPLHYGEDYDPLHRG